MRNSTFNSLYKSGAYFLDYTGKKRFKVEKCSEYKVHAEPNDTEVFYNVTCMETGKYINEISEKSGLHWACCVYEVNAGATRNGG